MVSPNLDHLIVYQLHPSCFSSRGGAGLSPLERVSWEIDVPEGYFKELGITAILLMPVNEFAGSSSWGYNPSFFYAVEESYGGPDAFKKLVDTCHRNGLAVLLDVVFNHAGTDDNILWEVSRETYFDGDTTWGALVNFDHPQCKQFFAQNLAYLAEEYRLDGFRLDHTHTIVHGHEGSWYIKQRGSGGGEDFLRACHRSVRELPNGGDRCLIMAEHLPNEWWWSAGDRPLDTQWNDDFHDRFEDACKGCDIMPALAEAFRVTHTQCDDWHDATNYSESHDEVGNENDRITNVAGPGRGLRMSKVAAAGTLLSRGIPMFFMGEESAESRQFRNDVLDLDLHLGDTERAKVRSWWKTLGELRRYSSSLRGPARLEIHYAQNQMLGFSRGLVGDYYVLLNFGS
jgi:1,4-alpha-glucan branching enzyme